MSFEIRRVREEKKPSKIWMLLSVGVPVMQCVQRLWNHYKEKNMEDQRDAQLKRRIRKIGTIVLSLLAVIALVYATFNIIIRIKNFTIDMVSMVNVTIPNDNHGFTNVLLLGEGDNNHDGVDLTDTMMIASADPGPTKSVVMISIPRDTYVLKTEKMGRGRINSLYRDYKISLQRKGMEAKEASQEAMKQLAKEIGSMFGIDIHGVVKINFSGFEQGVDLLGGIDIDVPETIVDTEYPGPNYTYKTFRITKGLQHLDGATALQYARSRHTTSDFSRSGRQQEIIRAIGKKLQDQGLITSVSKLNNLYDILAANIESTFTINELIGLASLGRSLDTSRVINVQLNDQNGLYGSIALRGGFLYSPPRDQFDGAAVLLPVSVPPTPVTWKQIDAFSQLLISKRMLFLQPSTITILNGTKKSGIAAKLGYELERYGFSITTTGNFTLENKKEQEKSIIALDPKIIQGTAEHQESDTNAQQTLDALSDLVGIAKGALPQEVFMTKNTHADIVIVLGKDYTFTPLQDLIHEKE